MAQRKKIQKARIIMLTIPVPEGAPHAALFPCDEFGRPVIRMRVSSTIKLLGSEGGRACPSL